MKAILIISLLIVFLPGCSGDSQNKKEIITLGFETQYIELSVSGESFGELIFELPEEVIDGDWNNIKLGSGSSELVSINLVERLYAVKNMPKSGIMSVNFEVDDLIKKITYNYTLTITDESSEGLEKADILRYRLGQCSFEFS